MPRPFRERAGIVAVLTWEYRRNWWALGLIALGTGVVILAYLQVRTGPSAIPSASALHAQLGNGIPVVVVMYSDL